MIEPPKYRYAFRKFDGATATWLYFAILGGVVDTTTGVTWLSKAPKEWLEEGASIDRGFDWFGMFTSNTTPMNWTGEPAKILRHIFLTEGVEGECELYIEMFNSATGVWDYEPFLPKGVALDFNTFNDNFDWVTINAMEGGFVAKLKARADTEYEIEVESHTDVKYLYNDGIELQARMNWIGLTGEDCNSYPTLAFVGTEGTNITFHPYTQSGADPHVQLITNTSGVSADVEMYFSWRLGITQTSGYTAYLHIDYITYDVNTFVNIATIPIEHSVTGHATGTSQVYSGDNTQTLTLGDDVGVFIMIRMYVVSPAGYVSDGSYSCTIHGLECNGYLINRYEPTYHPMLKASTVFEELITKINDDPFGIPTTYSDLIDTTLNGEIYISCGDAIRGLSGSIMKITFNQFFNLFKYDFNAATYYDIDMGRVYINDKSYVFKNSPHSSMPSLGEVKSCKVMPFSSEMFVNLTIGGGTFTYDQQRNDDLEITNGKDELNLNYNLLSPITKVKKDTLYVSDIRKDCHGAELIRINLSDKKISDSASDNDLFTFHCTKDPVDTFDLNGVTTDYYELIRTPINLTAGASFFNIENVFSPESIYNVIFFPIKSIYRCGEWFRSLLKFSDSKDLKMQSKSSNSPDNLKPVVSEGVGPVVYDGNADILISSLCDDGREICYPVILDVVFKEPVNLYKLTESDKYAYVTIDWIGNTYKCWIKSIASKPTLRGETVAQLIPTIDNDLTLLIR